jgi:hypothetical protein
VAQAAAQWSRRCWLLRCAAAPVERAVALAAGRKRAGGRHGKLRLLLLLLLLLLERGIPPHLLLSRPQEHLREQLVLVLLVLVQVLVLAQPVQLRAGVVR